MTHAGTSSPAFVGMSRMEHLPPRPIARIATKRSMASKRGRPVHPILGPYFAFRTLHSRPPWFSLKERNARRRLQILASKPQPRCKVRKHPSKKRIGAPFRAKKSYSGPMLTSRAMATWLKSRHDLWPSDAEFALCLSLMENQEDGTQQTP